MREARRRWRASSLVLAAAVAVTSAIVVPIWLAVPADSSDPVPGPDGITRACATGDDLIALAAELDGIEPVTADAQDADAPVVAFLGDSYTVGLGAAFPDRRWSTIVASELGWIEHNAGASGTGYAATYAMPGAPLSESYGARVADVVAARPDVVVVSGGRNDLRCDLQVVAEGASLVLVRLRALLPDATIVVVDPWWGATDAPPGLDDVRVVVELAAAEAGVVVLDTAQPLATIEGGTIDGMAIDGIHPDDLGHAAIATAVLEGLQSIDGLVPPPAE